MKLIDGKKRKLAKPVIGRLKKLEALDGDGFETLIQAMEICVEGDLSDIDWDEVDIRDVQGVIHDFLSQVNPIAAQRLNTLLGLDRKPTANSGSNGGRKNSSAN